MSKSLEREVSEFFKRLPRKIPGFERRPSQEQMAAAVARALERPHNGSGAARLLIEAGPGTGKSLAYLIPALLSDRKVVVSTATRYLQEQIIKKDLPLLFEKFSRKLTGKAAAVLKGRSNYLCLYRMQGLGTESLKPHDPLSRWAASTETGDRAEAPIAERSSIWESLTVDSHECLGLSCPEFDPCFITQARLAAARADLVIVNHHLFFSDLFLKEVGAGGVIPHYDAVILDEAHEVEEIAAAAFGSSLSPRRFFRLAADIRRAGEPETSVQLGEAAARFFSAVGEFNPGRRFAEGDRDRLRVEAAPLREALKTAASGAERLDPALSPPIGREFLESIKERALRLSLELLSLLKSEGEALIWTEQKEELSLRSMPLNIAPVLKSTLFAREIPIILTSATLSAGDDFNFIRSQTGIEPTEEHVLPSPFDYARQAILYIPEDIPSPSDPDFPAAVAEEILRLVEIVGGRTFALFTSRKNLENVYRLAAGRLSYPALKQGERPNYTLLEEFRSRPSVLFATQGFWQGVDIAGDTLSAVIIDKLPFAPPTDPRVEARIEEISSAGGDPFRSFQVPSAILMLKQGLGRLIRTSRDRGLLAILDRRLTSRSYGRLFLNAIPPFRRTSSKSEIARFFASL